MIKDTSNLPIYSKKVRIVVALHKDAQVFNNSVYMPIHVGKSLSKIGLKWQGDNTGDNISDKNPYFCELTAQYWAWKNIKDVEYIGLCHYRRYFEKEFTQDNIDELMKDCDVILPERSVMPHCCLVGFSNFHTPEDANIFRYYMNKRFPNQTKEFETVFLNRNYGNAYNMFVCKKSVFDKFCEWQFSILMDLFEIIPISPYVREKRLMGYLAENLFAYYAIINHLKIKEMPIVSMIGDKNTNNSIKTKCRHLLLTSWFKFNHKTYIPSQPVMLGLEMDGYFKKIDDLLSRKNY